MSGVPAVVGADGVARCPWGAGDPVNTAYHDTEWGMRVSGEAAHLERLTLEAFQSGLSWLTILNKRPHFRSAFAGFDADAVAAFGEADVERLMADAGIVRNRRKVDAAIANARATVALRERGRPRGVHLVVPARPAPGAPHDGRRADHVARVGGARQGPEEARLRPRRAHHDVRPDGGHRPRRRPPGGLSPTGLRH